MATLLVTKSTDFRGGAAESNIDVIQFNSSLLATATFSSFQFGAGLISNTVKLVGDGATNNIEIFLDSTDPFSAFGWTFQNWGGNDTIIFRGGIGDDTIVGSAQRDVIFTGGGLDDISTGAGNDQVNIDAPLAEGSRIDLGSASDDRIALFVASGTADLRPAAIAGVEQMNFINVTTAIVDGDQIGGDGFIRIQGSIASPQTLIVKDSRVDLRGVQFLDWGPEDKITIEGTESFGNLLIGSDQADTIQGSGNSNDVIVGSLGADTLLGGNGGDTFRYISTSEVPAGEIIDGGDGLDTIAVSNFGQIDFSAAKIIDVEALDFLDGLLVVTFTADQIGTGAIFNISGSGARDQIVVNVASQTADLSALTFSSWTDGVDLVSINGTSSVDTITGSSQDDIIDGKAGLDKMTGGLGDDTYVVDNVGDKVVEVNVTGVDTVNSSVTFSLAGQFVENLTLTGTAAINGTGNSLANTILGNSGANIINGGTSADTMTGGLGGDTYIVDNIEDKVVEKNETGFDKIESSVSFALTGQFVEQLTLTGAAAINATGNSQANTLIGNSAANIIAGGKGLDTLTGKGGGDVFLLNTALSATTNVDTITDYSVTDDTFQLARSVFTGFNGFGQATAGRFFANTTGLAHDADDRIIYETDTGKLFYDADGTGATAGVHFATVAMGLALTNADFVIV